MKKRLIRFGAAVVLALLVAGGLVFWSISGKGSGRVEKWIESQVLTIANSYLNPKLSFSDLDYTYPYSVSLKNMRLTADDPAHPGKSIDVIACESASITLAEIPSIGKPIVIEKISLNKPLISAVAVATGSKEFVGFSNLIKVGAMSDKPATKVEEKPAGAPKKLSEVFRMKLVQLVDGKIVYDPRIPGTLPMALDQINTTLTIDTTADGWYKVNTNISRKPVFDLAVAGELNLDSFTVRGIDIKLLADLGQEKLDYLPPEIQALLKQYEGKGKLNVQITGTMPVMDPMKGEVQADVKLDSANFAMGDLHLPVENFELQAKFADGKVSLPSMKIAALGGTADLSGSATLNDRLDADLKLKVSGMVLENLLKTGPSANAAKLDLDFKVAGSLMAIIGKVPPAAGQPLGAISLQNFRLSANDPANPGQTVDVVAVKNLDVALAEPVVAGKPIVIEKIILDSPTLSAIAVAPNSFQFVGVPTLPPSLTAPVAGDAPTGDGAKPQAGGGAVAPAPVASSQKLLSELIRVKTFQLNNAKIVYDPRIPNTQRMWLDGINTSLNVAPKDPGVYVLSTAIGRKPIFDLSIDGRINIDHPGVQDFKLNLLADLTKNQLDYLPPQLQAILKQTDAKGTLNVAVAGSIPLDDPMKGQITADVKLEHIEVATANMRLPIERFNLTAKVANGKVEIPAMQIAALGNYFNLRGTAALNDRMDTDLTLMVHGVVLEDLVAALRPNDPRMTSETRLDADVEIQTPVMAALGLIPAKPGEPVATVTLKAVHLNTDDPRARGASLDFVACDSLAIKLLSLPVAGKPIVVDSVVVTRPAIRAVAMAPGSNDFAGVVSLQKMAAAFVPSAQPEGPAPATKPAEPAAPNAPVAAAKLSDLFRADLVQVNGAILYYDPRVKDTLPMSLDQIVVKITPTTQAGDVYAFQTLIPHAPDFNLDLAGRMNINTLAVDGMKLTFATDLGKKNPTYLPPQLQQVLAQYQVQGVLSVEGVGSVPLTDPMAADLTADVRIEQVKATASGFTGPIAHVRLPVHVKDHLLMILPAESMGGSMADVFDGTVDLAGTVKLDEYFTSTLDLTVKKLQLKYLATAKQPPDPQMKDLEGLVDVNVHLEKAPLLVIAAHAAPPTTRPSDPPPSPLRQVPLTGKWATGTIHVTEARLAGLEMIQKLGNFAKSAVFEITKQFDKEKTLTVKPKETATLVFDCVDDRVTFSKVEYEGEIVAVEGTGTITLAQALDFTLKGGPWGKLGELVKNNVNSLLTYRITGTVQNYDFSVTTGNGKIITDEVKDLAGKAGEGIDKGLDATKKGLGKAGDLLGNIFNKKKDGE